ncbi:hypothetical protein EYF80_031230 [Liparis tanakae]|uniref:Uncharacterized protein n=1 Tax=Liparis tanakae TaxID=230148 RepID=A0A4Z2GZD3_9TELE|nr:hypothetical protein EYF80_031230 [Liparis tanakae]
MTCPNSSSGVSPKKGTQPTRNSYRMMPIAHQSTGFPLVVRLISPILERPKSVSLMCPMEVMRRLRDTQRHLWQKDRVTNEEDGERRNDLLQDLTSVESSVSGVSGPSLS